MRLADFLKSLSAAEQIEFQNRLDILSTQTVPYQKARHLIANLGSKPLDTIRRRLKRIPLGYFVMWATFNEHDGSANPFARLPDNANGVRACLGLPKEKGDLFLLVYSLPVGTEPRFPTVADSCAGDTWNYYFRPALPGAPYGKTMCWNDPDHADAFPCPEIVHSPVCGAFLITSIREVKDR